MRTLTKKLGEVLYHDGPAIVATALFAAIFVSEVADSTS